MWLTRIPKENYNQIGIIINSYRGEISNVHFAIFWASRKTYTPATAGSTSLNIKCSIGRTKVFQENRFYVS